MKKREYIYKLIIALFLTLTFVFATYTNTTNDKSKSISPSEKTVPVTLQGQINITLDNSLLDRLEQMARDKLLLEQEAADLKHQIEEFGRIKPAMDKEGVNP